MVSQPTPTWHLTSGKCFYSPHLKLILSFCTPYLLLYRTVRLIITRYRSTFIIPKLAFLSTLQNLHTLQILHAHLQMTKAIKSALRRVVLPKIHTLIIPEHCHGILKSCPHVTKVWCNRGDGSTLVTAIGKYCKEVQEMRGFSADGNLIKSAL